MKFPKELSAILSNKYVLYVVAFLAITNVIGYLAIQDFTSLLFFVLIGYLTSYFSKNMTVVLLSALVLTNLLMSTRRIRIQEGFTEGLEKNDVGELKPGAAEGNDDRSDGAVLAGAEDEEKEDEAVGAPDTEPDSGAPLKKAGHEPLEGLSPSAVRDGFQGARGQDIVKQQKLIKENLESIKPMLKTAKEMLGTLNDAKDMISQFGGLSDMLPGM